MVELLIVVVVLALLTLVSGTTYIATMKTARDGKRKVDLENIRSALEVYRSDKSTYPVLTDKTTGQVYVLRDLLDPSVGKKYITLPTDPTTKLDYHYEPADCTDIGTPIITVCNSYIIATRLENAPKTAPSATCTQLVAPSGKPACIDDSNGSAECNYCLDPYGLLPVSAAQSEDEGVGEIQLPANE